MTDRIEIIEYNTIVIKSNLQLSTVTDGTLTQNYCFPVAHQ